jgi:hypothetical protein
LRPRVQEQLEARKFADCPDQLSAATKKELGRKIVTSDFTPLIWSPKRHRSVSGPQPPNRPRDYTLFYAQHWHQNSYWGFPFHNCSHLLVLVQITKRLHKQCSIQRDILHTPRPAHRDCTNLHIGTTSAALAARGRSVCHVANSGCSDEVIPRT